MKVEQLGWQRRLKVWAAGLLVGVFLAVGKAEAGGTVSVFAASSLTGAFHALQPAFERENPGWKLRLNFGASSTLRTQIEQGAPADLFASADYAQIQPLAAAGRVELPRTFARSRLIVVMPRSNPGKVKSLQDLGRPGLRLVSTPAAVPIGRYSANVLDRLARGSGFPRDFAQRVAANVVSREANVRAVLSKVELGEADAAMVYEVDARASKSVMTLPIPESENVVVEYPIAVVADTRRRDGATAFINFLRSKAGRIILHQYGFR